MLRKEPARHVAEAVAVSLLLSAIVFIPQWRYFYNWADEGLLWYLSQRIHFGQMPIRDFFGYDPGRYLWSAAWFKVLGGDGLFEQRLANACFGAIGLSAAYWAMLTAGIRRPYLLATITLLAIALGYPLHKIYEQSLSLIAVALLAHALFSPAVARRWMVLGLATGLAAIFGRNSGLYYALAAVFGLCIAWCQQPVRIVMRGFVSYAAGVAIGYAPMVLWFVSDPRFRQAMIQSIVFTPQWQLPLRIPFPWHVAQDVSSVLSIQAMAASWLCVAVFAIYAMTAAEVIHALVRRRLTDRPWMLEAACLCVGIPYLHQGFDRADFAHIAQGILPIFILVVARLHREQAFLPRTVYAVFACISLLAWVPVEPRVAAHLQFRQDPGRLVHFNMDGRDFIVDRDEARVLHRVRHEFERCNAGPGQLVAMPYYPGIFAYLRTPSPYWETYFLYHRSADFQQQEIAEMETHQTKLAIINRIVSVDGRNDLKIEQTNPVLVRYIQTHFARLPAQSSTADDFEVYERNCAR